MILMKFFGIKGVRQLRNTRGQNREGVCGQQEADLCDKQEERGRQMKHGLTGPVIKTGQHLSVSLYRRKHASQLSNADYSLQ
ncbi:hypothetical protein D3M71_20105 [Erwinia billingiae]|nr:hypothetical protein [Erwinia billingiae]